MIQLKEIMQQSQQPQIPVRVEPKHSVLDGIIMESADLIAKDVDGNEFQVGRVEPTSTGKTVQEFVQEALDARDKLVTDTITNLKEQLAVIDKNIDDFGDAKAKADLVKLKEKDTKLDDVLKKK